MNSPRSEILCSGWQISISPTDRCFGLRWPSRNFHFIYIYRTYCLSVIVDWTHQLFFFRDYLATNIMMVAFFFEINHHHTLKLENWRHIYLAKWNLIFACNQIWNWVHNCLEEPGCTYIGYVQSPAKNTAHPFFSHSPLKPSNQEFSIWKM